MEVQRGSPRQSLWRLIEEQVPHSELPEVRTVLGQSLVDMYTEVHSEVDMWLGIWREIKQGCNCSNRRETPRYPLADPPVVKELLRGEVRMLLQSIRERACMEGRDGEEVWSRYDPDTVNYALGHSSRCDPWKSTQLQQGSSVGDELEAVRDKLNVVHIDCVVAHLRCVLTEDCEALKRQLLWVQIFSWSKESSPQDRHARSETPPTRPETPPTFLPVTCQAEPAAQLSPDEALLCVVAATPPEVLVGKDWRSAA
ncbi:unnamed protein product [Lota lota]